MFVSTPLELLIMPFLIGRFDLLESPLWLIRKGRIQECEKMMENCLVNLWFLKLMKRKKHIFIN